MSIGWVAFIGIFVLAAACALWNARLRRSAGRRLAALGFEPCDDQAPALAAGWQALASATGSPREIRVASCHRRAGGWGMLHHFDVLDVTNARGRHRDTAAIGGAYPAYLLDLREPEAVGRRPVTLYLAKPRSRVLRALLRRVIDLDPAGAPLEVGPHPWAASILAAYGSEAGKLDDWLPAGAQEKLARAAEHGFFLIHLASGKLGLGVLAARRNVDTEWRYLAEWI